MFFFRFFFAFLRIGRPKIGRKKADQKLKESERKFRTAVENSPNFIVFIKRDGTIVEVNRLVKGFTKEKNYKCAIISISMDIETKSRTVKKQDDFGVNLEIQGNGFGSILYAYKFKQQPLN